VGLVPRPLSAPQPEFVVSATHLVNPDAAVLDQPPAEMRTPLRGASRQRLAESLEGVRPALQLDRIHGVPAPSAILELVETQGLSPGQRCPFRFRTALYGPHKNGLSVPGPPEPEGPGHGRVSSHPAATSSSMSLRAWRGLGAH
jgi:hypothetical protein